MVEFKVVYDKKIIDKLAEIQIEKSKANVKKFANILFMISSVLIVLAICFWNNEDVSVWLLGLGLFGLIFGAVFPSILKKQIIKNYNKISESNTYDFNLTEETYKFDDEKVFVFTSKGKDYRSAVETNYGYFESVYEDKDCYILYVSNVQCHVIFKTDIVKGTLEEFEALIKKNISSDAYIKNFGTEINKF